MIQNPFFPEIHGNFGFGCMRLPMKDGKVNYDEFCRMADVFIASGLNYFDTAHGYIGGQSETAIRDCVSKRYDRSRFLLTDIIVTPLAIDEFNGPRGDFYKNMFAKCPAGRPGTTDEVANVAELLMSDKGAFIAGSTFLIDGGATSSYYYGPLQPNT